MAGPLILIPTIGELKVIAPRLAELQLPAASIQLCGFGPVSSAARTAQLLAAIETDQIFLVGIAGALNRNCATGRAFVFDDVAMYGIGAGTGDTFRNAGELGWNHWTSSTPDGGEIRVGDRIMLRQEESDKPLQQLLTVCSAAATQKDVRDRLAKFPAALAEDMEGFSVAFAGAMAGVPVKIVRGISNIAGDREKSRWRIADALHAATDLLKEQLS